MSTESTKPSNFIRQIIDDDLASGKHAAIQTRFPPEPNGYLHIGHAKSIVLNFGVAEDYQGLCNLRFDDTNPGKEDVEFVEAIQGDVHWLGYEWSGRYFASDYFEQLYGFAEELIQKGLAYVDDQTAEQMREGRGSLTEAGKASPYRNRSIEENLDLFRRMRQGEFPDGSRVLRAKIDMSSPNINMRDPALYRIRHGVVHHQTGAVWCLYPMYDYTHPISDALEGITHSLCTLEFEDHRPLYDWVLDNITIPCHPRQIEFARLNLEYTVMSKRKLTQLVEEELVHGWDDPRMPTIAGLRRRGFTPESIKDFCGRIGITKSDATVEMGLLESCIRDDLDANAPRRMAVLRPLKVIIDNWPEERVDELSAPNHPKHEELGQRTLKMTREIYIDREDFIEVAPNKKWKRLVLGGEVRLRNSYVIKCEEMLTDDAGELIGLRASVDMDTLGKNPEGRKVKGVIHWVSASHGVPAEVRLYDRLFNVPNPGGGGSDFRTQINPESLAVIETAVVEPALAEPGTARYQFEREGYFVADPDGQTERLVFNRVVTLRDSWGKANN